jgi:single-strand DNA-binding protein
MAQLNKVLLIGNLTRDPEVRYTPSGAAVADLGLAINRRYRTEKGEDKEEVCYVTVVVWGKQAETAGKYLKKGRPLFVEGRLQYETWEKSGEKRSTLKVVCERFQFLGSAPGGGGSQGAEGDAEPSEAPSSGHAPKERGGGNDAENDDIPF